MHPSSPASIRTSEPTNERIIKYNWIALILSAKSGTTQWHASRAHALFFLRGRRQGVIRRAHEYGEVQNIEVKMDRQL